MIGANTRCVPLNFCHQAFLFKHILKPKYGKNSNLLAWNNIAML